MKSSLIALVVLFYSSSYAAQTSQLSCQMAKYPDQVIQFKMVGLGTPDIDFLRADENDDYSAVFTTESEDLDVIAMVDSLNGQGGDLRVSNDKILFFGDSAGIDFVYLVLYKNSRYTKGYVRWDLDFGNVKGYSKLSCTLAKM